MVPKLIIISCKYYRRCGDVLLETLIDHTEDIKQILIEMQEIVALVKEEHAKNEQHFEQIEKKLSDHFGL